MTTRTIVLSGFMATGKTTVGRLLAARLGLPFVDTDDLVAADAGRAVPEVWRAEGEPAFRARERRLIAPLLEDGKPRVLAFGGGAVTSRSLRHLALDRALLVTLTADPTTIAARAGATLAERPNLGVGGDPAARAGELLAQRASAYAECHLAVATDSLDPDGVVDAVLPWVDRDLVAMPLGERSYVIEIARAAPERVSDAIASAAPSTIVVVTDAHVARARGHALDAALERLAMPSVRVTLAPGEIHKNATTVGAIWDAALGAGIDRDALVVAFGGGVVGDLAGFAAATLLRGVRCLQVPTTLLAMVDSSVGGKTGFDHPAGKNLVGAFHQPCGVVVDLSHLDTLPARERVAGLAEVAKIALTADAALLARLEADAERLAAEPFAENEALAAIVHAAIAAKARIVRDDERESGARALLNVGHTIGHALEAHGGFHRWLHGEAVALGTLAELEATTRLGFTPPELVGRARRLLERLGLPTRVAPTDLTASWPFVGSDKKRRGSHLRLPVVTGPGAGRVVSLDSEKVRAATFLALHERAS